MIWLLIKILFLAQNHILQLCEGYGFEITFKSSPDRLDPPGYGFDYLEDKNTLNPIFRLTYSNNTINGINLNDNVQYLIPDCFEYESPEIEEFWVDPLIENINEFVSIYEWTSTIDTGKRSIDTVKTQNSLFLEKKRRGIWSQEAGNLIDEQLKSKTITTSVRYNRHTYTVKAAFNCPLDKNFIDLIEEIYTEMSTSNNDDAEYLAGVLVREYGTDYIKSHGYGGKLSMDMYLSASYRLLNKNDSQMKNNSMLLFRKQFMAYDYVQTNKIEFQEFESSVKEVKVKAIGASVLPAVGACSGQNSSCMSAWQILINQFAKSKAVIMRDIAPIGDLIDHDDLKKIITSRLMREKIKKLIQNITDEYVNRNSYTGCLERDSVKFSTNYATYQPNREICEEDYKFGGTFAHTYHCTNLQCINTFEPCPYLEVNILTNNKNCTKNFNSILVYETEDTKGPWSNLTMCRGSSESKIYFGGIYSVDNELALSRAMIKNPVTNGANCPEYFSAVPLFDCFNNKICLSVDKRAVVGAVPFGGFISSCMSNVDQNCPQGYAKYRVNTYNKCTLYYCTQIKSWPRPGIKKPPFTKASSYS